MNLAEAITTSPFGIAWRYASDGALWYFPTPDDNPKSNMVAVVNFDLLRSLPESEWNEFLHHPEFVRESHTDLETFVDWQPVTGKA